MRLPPSPTPGTLSPPRAPFSAAVLVLIAGSLSSPATAAAQRWAVPTEEPSPAAVAEARDLYTRGSEAADEQRWSDAIAHFERSYALSGAAVALYSLAYTLRAVGRFRDARDTFDQLLRDPDLEDDLRGQALPLREEVAAKVAVLNLQGLELHAEARVQLDAAVVQDHGERPFPVEADPGAHALRVDAPGFSPYEWRGTLGGGDRLTLEVTLEEAGAPWYENPWVWAGAGAVVVIVAVITAVVVQGNAQLDSRTEYHLQL